MVWRPSSLVHPGTGSLWMTRSESFGVIRSRSAVPSNCRTLVGRYQNVSERCLAAGQEPWGQFRRLGAGANGIGDEGGWPAALNCLRTSAR
jgi:hypothetical protein